MKIITASTSDQQKYLRSLIKEFYTDIFPAFYSSNYVSDLQYFGVLELEPIENYSLKEIFEVTVSLQTIKILLECILEQTQEHHHSNQFITNQDILEKNNVYFPFNYLDFIEASNTMNISMVKPDNEWMI